jgi:hypothetical protein
MMQRFKNLLIIFFLLLPFILTEAEENLPDPSLEQTLEALKQKGLLSSSQNGAYYYNLGTLNYRLGKIGLAYAYLEKARILDPSDADVHWNWSQAQSSLIRLLGESSKLDPATSEGLAIVESLPWWWFYYVFGVLSFGSTLLWANEYRKHREPKHAFTSPFGRLSLSALLCIFLFIGLEWYCKTTPVGICIQADWIRSGPGESYETLAKVETGVKLRFFETSSLSKKSAEGKGEQSNVWRQVRYSATEIGWIRESSLLRL